MWKKKLDLAHLGRPECDHPEHAAAGHIQQGAGEIRPPAADRYRRQGRAVRRSASAEAGGAGHGLCRAIQRASARGRCGRPLRAAGRLPEFQRRFFDGRAGSTATVRSIRSRSGPKTAITRCPTWRGGPTAAPGRRMASRRFASRTDSRQPFMPDGSRLFEEIDRIGIDVDGVGNMISNKAEVDFSALRRPAAIKKGRDCGDQRSESATATSRRKIPARISSRIGRHISGTRHRV